jgi:hypothetical protein
MCKRAVFSEGDAARPITASQPPGRARKTSKHYRSRLARPLLEPVSASAALICSAAKFCGMSRPLF